MRHPAPDRRGGTAVQITAPQFLDFCEALFHPWGMIRADARLMDGIRSLLDRRSDLVGVFSDAFERSRRVGVMVFLSQPVLQRIRYEPCMSLAHRHGIGIENNFKFYPASVLARLVMSSPMRAHILNDPTASAALVSEILHPKTGPKLLLAMMCEFGMDELVQLVRQNGPSLSEFRDENGNTFAYYLVALRSSARATLELLNRFCPGTLGAVAEDGLSALDLLNGNDRVAAEKMVLKKEAGKPPEAKRAVRRSF